MSVEQTQLDRATGALWGVALGDAMGMPSQTLMLEEIVEAYGWIDDFIDPKENHPVSHGLSAGCVTDDTEQTLLLAQHILSNPDDFDEQAWAKALLDWEAEVKQRGLHDLLGPSTKRALESLIAGTPVTETGITGTTNGASMRITPVAIATPVEPLGRFLDQIELTCRVTHNTAEALSAAAAVAAVVSAGIEGAGFEEAVPVALLAAREAGKRGALQGDVDIAERIERAMDVAGSDASEAIIGNLNAEIGTSVASRDSVAAAFGVANAVDGDVWRAAVLSANIGDDTDTIGAIACSMIGATTGASAMPQEKIAILKSRNNLQPESTAEELLAVRARREATR